MHVKGIYAELKRMGKVKTLKHLLQGQDVSVSDDYFFLK